MNILYFGYKLISKFGKFFFPKYYTIIAKLKFRILDVSFGKNLIVDGKVILSPVKGKITIGHSFQLNSRYKSNLVGLTTPATFQVIRDGKIQIGNNCGFSSPVISSRKAVLIGNNVMLGGNVRIYDHDYHSLNHLHRKQNINEHPHVLAKEVIIEDDVFIGVNVTILKGVSIGARSIIGAGSVVTIQRIPPDSTVAGNPAKIINK